MIWLSLTTTQQLSYKHDMLYEPCEFWRRRKTVENDIDNKLLKWPSILRIKKLPLVSTICANSECNIFSSICQFLENLCTYIHTVGEKKDWTKRNIWSKTTLIASGVSRAGVNPPFCKMGIFFHRSLALSEPIYRNFQSNGGKWRSHKLWMKKFI